MKQRELEIIGVWALIGLFVGIVATPYGSLYPFRCLCLGIFGAGVGFLLVVKLRLYRRR